MGMITALKTDADSSARINSEANKISRDSQRIAQCRAGNLDAFGQVYAECGEVVFRHAFYLLGHHEDADDVKQETFLRAFRALHTFRQDSAILTWLLRICGNLCYDRLKHRQRRAEISFDAQQVEHYLPASPAADPHFVLDRANTLQTLLRVLQALPPPQRNVIVLHIIEGLDYRQIGEILECKPTTAKMRVLRATRLFKARASVLLNAP